ncbi:MAG TPA: MFS transporter [Thermodesulfobacteriota bacterium]|nr:MFS transporter [Thermodesulfobacteriota bacterium]
MSRRNAMLAVMISLFFFSFFYRTSPAVISPHLLRDFSLGAEKLGLLSSIFFIVFAVAQIPLGPALDFIGPRKVVSVLGMLGALGSLTFALAPSYEVCLLGRGLTGLGMSCMYMGTLTIVANWYPPRQFATLTGIVSSLGNAGALTATIPLALLAGSLGWRGSFHLFAALNLLLAVLAWVVIRDRPARVANQPVLSPRHFSLGKAFRAVLGTPTFWFIATLNFFTAGSFLAFQGLWGGPFLMDGFELSPVEAGSVLSMIAFGYIIGCPLIGMISDRLVPSRKTLTLIILSIYLVPLLSLSFFLGPGRNFFLFPVFFSIGLFASGVVLSISHLKELFPTRIVGTALSLNNLFAIGGAGILQYLMGWIIERHPAVGRIYPIEAYQEAFLLLLGGMAGSLLLYLRAKDSNPPSLLSPPKK